jgi:hypothetical protein
MAPRQCTRSIGCYHHPYQQRINYCCEEAMSVGSSGSDEGWWNIFFKVGRELRNQDWDMLSMYLSMYLSYISVSAS